MATRTIKADFEGDQDLLWKFFGPDATIEVTRDRGRLVSALTGRKRYAVTITFDDGKS